MPPSYQDDLRSIRCLLGIHRWTTLPRGTVESAQRAHVTTTPIWYAGPQAPRWCLRCGKDKA